MRTRGCSNNHLVAYAGPGMAGLLSSLSDTDDTIGALLSAEGCKAKDEARSGGTKKRYTSTYVHIFTCLLQRMPPWYRQLARQHGAASHTIPDQPILRSMYVIANDQSKGFSKPQQQERCYYHCCRYMEQPKHATAEWTFI